MIKTTHILILLLLIVSCKSPENPNNIGSEKNDVEFEDNNLGENINIQVPNTSSREYIDRKYPYWKVNVGGFFIEKKIPTYTTITIEEKKHVLTALALMRLMVNTEEFDDAIKKYKGEFISSINAQYPNGKYNIKKGQVYNRDRIIEVIKNTSYTTRYIKANYVGSYALALLGNSWYVFYGYKENIPTGDFIKMANLNWKTKYQPDIVILMNLLFHEHLHNIGFYHANDDTGKWQDMPTQMQYAILSLGYSLVGKGDIGKKYSEQFNELKEYYFKEYADLLKEDTVHNPYN